jgi:predicted molibdopterin-dependent oxidoreductase YjgC
MTNSARGISLVRKVMEPPGEARPDWRIVCEVARRMGFGRRLDFADEEAIFEEYKRCTRGRPNDIGGLTYARLGREGPLQWPVPSEMHPGTPRRFLDGEFPVGALRVGLFEQEDAGEEPDAEYPFVLMTGVRVPHYHSGTRTGRIRTLKRHPLKPHVDVHPADAMELGLEDGQPADVATRRGSLRLPVRVTDVVPRGTVFVPYHAGAGPGGTSNVNVLTHRSFDAVAMQPEYKYACVRLRSTASTEPGTQSPLL